jgi:hypothetical protein
VQVQQQTKREQSFGFGQAAQPIGQRHPGCYPQFQRPNQSMTVMNETQTQKTRTKIQKGKTSDFVFFALFQRISRKFGISFGDRKVSFVQLVDFDSFDQLNRRELGSHWNLN